MKWLSGSIAVIASATFAVAAVAQSHPHYRDVSVAAGETADAYFNAYVGREWDRIEPLVADNVRFQDPTARLIFGGAEHVGKPALMKAFREGYSSISAMSFEPQRILHSGEYGIFEGTLTWTLNIEDLTVTSATPIVTIVRVENGKVSEHYDYVDYAPFVESLQAARAAAGK